MVVRWSTSSKGWSCILRSRKVRRHRPAPGTSRIPVHGQLHRGTVPTATTPRANARTGRDFVCVRPSEDRGCLGWGGFAVQWSGATTSSASSEEWPGAWIALPGAISDGSSWPPASSSSVQVLSRSPKRAGWGPVTDASAMPRVRDAGPKGRDPAGSFAGARLRWRASFARLRSRSPTPRQRGHARPAAAVHP